MTCAQLVPAIAKRSPHGLTDEAKKTRYGVLKRVRERTKNNGQEQKRSAGIGVFQARVGGWRSDYVARRGRSGKARRLRLVLKCLGKGEVTAR